MPGCGEQHHEGGRSDLHFRSVNTAVPTGTPERSNRKIHRNSIRITVDLMVDLMGFEPTTSRMRTSQSVRFVLVFNYFQWFLLTFIPSLDLS